MTLLRNDCFDYVEKFAPQLIRPLEAVKRETVESAMILCGGNMTKAAERLKISYSGLRKLLLQYRKEDSN